MTLLLAALLALQCQFILGFKTLADLIPNVVGQCLEDERHNPENGDGLQQTTGGLLVWRKADNWTAFTDGHRTWVNGPFGLQQRLNAERFPWESGGASVPVSTEEVVRGDPSRPWVSLVFNAGAGYPPAPRILDTLKAKGVRTTFFLMGWWAEKEPDLVRRIAASLGFRPILWTLDSGDWQFDSSGDAVRRRVLNNTANGYIVVMHFESPRTADSVSFALPDMIDGLRARGLRLVTVTELVTGQLRA